MPCPGKGPYLKVRLSLTFASGPPWSLVSGRPPLPPVWVPPRVPLWPVGALVLPRVAVASEGHAGYLVGLAASWCSTGLFGDCGVEQCWAAGWLTIASRPQQCHSRAQFSSICCSLLYEWWSLPCFCGHPSLDMGGRWASLLVRFWAAPRARDSEPLGTDWARGSAQGRVPPRATV